MERAYQAAQRCEGLQDRAIAFFETLLAYHERDLVLARALMRQLGYVDRPEQRAVVNDLMTKLLRRLAQLVDVAKDKGEVARESPLHVSARALFAIYYFHLGGLLSGYIDRVQFDSALRTDIGLLLTGMGTRVRARTKSSSKP